ncbi:MAG: PilZ domain-containing protein [Candidatus Omnitrophota bacterium]
MTQENSDEKRINPEMISPADEDRRYLPRWEVNNRVVCLLKNDASRIECSSRDINCSGASIYSERDLTPAQKVKLTIYLDKNVLVNVDGKVCWSHPAEKQNLVGINFEETSKKVQDLILEYAFEVNKDKLTQHWFKGWSGV